MSDIPEWRAGSLADNLAVALRTRLAETGVSQGDLARRAGVSEKHLSQVINGRAGASVATWDRLFVALNTANDARQDTVGVSCDLPLQPLEAVIDWLLPRLRILPPLLPEGANPAVHNGKTHHRGR
ncbi:helix-turn-helix domain-containing protein [Gordonia westfalica]|uniref:Helix-turn-helix domain-containing protein n=1 Tax=Gordonia westfalica TaxID=158898 RepID=A0A1H2DSN0_9ACTN|nr:helix-turn-helix transcriptional regulator [Gordonia westfalica]SDT85857.1 Helix-turn-helix domain-containing protein [Gordonia westfalica]